jgi:hypothetical protein
MRRSSSISRIELSAMNEFTTSLDRDDPRFRLADATRRVIDELASSTADTAAFAAARDLVEQAASVLAAREHGRIYHSAAEASLADFQAMSFVDYSPFIGPLNPLAPPINMASTHEPGASSGEETTVIGSVVYGGAYEGPPGCVHGGFIAAGFDEVLGFAQARSGRPGMTGRLSISYRSPTPLLREVRFVGRIDRVEGRKIFTTAELVVAADGRLCAEAEGLFISMKPEVFERMIRDRPEQGPLPV